MKKVSNNIRVISAGSALGSVAVIDVLGDICQSWWTDGGFTKEAILNDFKSRNIVEVHFNISSLGGDYGEALAIKNMAVQTGAKIKVHYFGMVASAATEIGNAASRSNTTASSDFFMLIHNTSTWAGGNKEAILKTYDSLAKFDNGLAKNYAAKSGTRTAAEFAAKMTEDVWMNADEALEWGLIGNVTEAQPISAHALVEIKASMSKLKIKAPHANENNFINPNPNDVTEKTANRLFNKLIGLFENAGLKISASGKNVKVEELAYDITEKFRVAASRIMDEEQSTEQRPVDASYSAVVSEAVESIELLDGSKLRLARESYDVSDEGAESLQSDLSELLDAETVSVSFNEAQGALFIEVTTCKQELATCNGTIEFLSATDESATQQEVRNLEKELISAGKKLTAMNHANTGGKVKELKAELQKINNQIYAIAAGKSGGRTLGNKPVTIGANAGRDEENGAGFLTGVIKNYHSNNQ